MGLIHFHLENFVCEISFKPSLISQFSDRKQYTIDPNDASNLRKSSPNWVRINLNDRHISILKVQRQDEHRFLSITGAVRIGAFVNLGKRLLFKHQLFIWDGWVPHTIGILNFNKWHHYFIVWATLSPDLRIHVVVVIHLLCNAFWMSNIVWERPINESYSIIFPLRKLKS